jgi:hypothetical protein
MADLTRCDSQPLAEVSFGTLRPTFERQDSASTIHSASSRTSSHASSISGIQAIRKPAQLQTQVEEDEATHTSHWAAVRYAIAGAKQQIRQAQQHRRGKESVEDRTSSFGRAMSFGGALRGFVRKASAASPGSGDDRTLTSNGMF